METQSPYQIAFENFEKFCLYVFVLYVFLLHFTFTSYHEQWYVILKI